MTMTTILNNKLITDMRNHPLLSLLALAQIALGLWMIAQATVNGFRLYFEDYYPRTKELDSLMLREAATLPDQDKSSSTANKGRQCEITKNNINHGLYYPWGCSYPDDYTFYWLKWPDGDKDDKEKLFLWSDTLAEAQYKGKRYRIVRVYVSNPSSISWPGGRAHITLYLLRRARRGELYLDPLGEWSNTLWQVLEIRRLGNNIEGTVELVFEHGKPKMIVSNVKKRGFWDSYFDN